MEASLQNAPHIPATTPSIPQLRYGIARHVGSEVLHGQQAASRGWEGNIRGDEKSVEHFNAHVRVFVAVAAHICTNHSPQPHAQGVFLPIVRLAMIVRLRRLFGHGFICLLLALWHAGTGSNILGQLGFANAPIAPARNARLPRWASDDLDARRAKCPLSQAQLENDHGNKWEDVRDILVGLRASSPEAIMRVPCRGKEYMFCLVSLCQSLLFAEGMPLY